METVRHLHLDLEDTVIEPVVNGWPNTIAIPEKLKQIRRFIEIFKPHHVHIFSFAVWNEREHMMFCTYTKEYLERVLKVKFITVPTVDDDIIPYAARAIRMSPEVVSFQDASDFWGKGESFRLYLKHLWKDLPEQGRHVEAVLIDDAVENENFEWPDLHIKGRLLNVDSELWRSLTSSTDQSPNHS